MTTRDTYAGFDQACNASLSADGLFYHCHVWLNRADNRIDSACFVEQENGEPVEIWSNSVRIPAGADRVDCPKILAHGTTFVVHWVEANDTWTTGAGLHRATMDMDVFSPTTWTYRNSVAVHIGGTYHAKLMEGSTTDFLVIRKVLDTQVSLQRFNGPTWANIVWTTNYPVRARSTSVCIAGHNTDNDVVIGYDFTDAFDADNGFYVASFNATTGAFRAALPAFADHESIANGGRHVQSSIKRLSTGLAAVATEYEQTALAGLGAPYRYFHSVLARTFTTVDAVVIGDTQPTRHVSMLSELWTGPGGASLTSNSHTELYCVLGYKTVVEPGNWSQAYAYVVNFDVGIWQEFGYREVRARPVATLTGYGIPHSAPSGHSPYVPADLFGAAPGRRVGHVSAVCFGPPFGPRLKTVNIAAIVFERVSVQATDNPVGDATIVSELIPTNAAVTTYVFHMEDPWTVYRGPEMPTQPDTNFRQPYARAMHQTAKHGANLFVSGGTPQLYDGRQIVECGFPYNPEIIGATTEEYESGVAIVDGTRQMYVVARWRGKNAVHRSGPSNIVTLLSDTENGNGEIVLQIRTQSLSLKDALAHFPNSQPIEFEVFRTVADGVVFYRVFGSSVSPYRAEDIPVNDPNDFYIEISDLVPDTQITAQGLGPYQYQPDELGGPAAGFSTLVPVVVPALTCVTEHQGRIFGVNAQDGTWWYSSESRPEIGGELYAAPEFNPSRTFRVDGQGETVALKGMAETLYGWSRSAIVAMTGTAQSDSANVDSTLQLAVLHENIGCADPMSVTLTPPGVFFRASKGFYLLNRGRGADFIGADVADFVNRAGAIRNVTDFENRHQIRVSCDDVPSRQYSTLLQPSIFGTGEGVWSFTPDGEATAAYTAISSDTESDISLALLNRISALDYANVASVVLIGSDVRVTWVPDYFPDYTLAFPVDQTFTGANSSVLTVYPQALIFDYRKMLWTTRPLLPLSSSVRANSIASACAWEGSDGEIVHCVLQQGGLQIERESTDPTPYADSNALTSFGVPVDVQTSLIRMAGIAGAQRIRSAGVTTNKPNESQYRIDIGQVFESDYDNIEVEADLSITVSPQHMRVRPADQKCTAFYIRVYEVAPPITENVRILSMLAEVGIESGAFRPPTAIIGE